MKLVQRHGTPVNVCTHYGIIVIPFLLSGLVTWEVHHFNDPLHTRLLPGYGTATTITTVLLRVCREHATGNLDLGDVDAYAEGRVGAPRLHQGDPAKTINET